MGMMFGGGGGGGGWHGPPPRAGGGGWGQAGAPGLPFAGVPPEMLERVTEIQKTEPEHPDIPVDFSHQMARERGFSLRAFLLPHWVAIAVALVLVCLDTVAMQSGPLLTKFGIDRGIVGKNFGLLLTAAGAYVGMIVAHTALTYARTMWTGRLGEKLLLSLRIRVFSHIQRLSLDFFTDEKAGRIMTRMTSDIEALHILFNQGLISLFVQLLTLVVVCGALFLMNVRLAIVTILVIVPVLTALSWWFRNASDRGYLAVRDKIADVLADLSESLSGIRIVAMYNRQRHNVIRHRNVVGVHMDSNLYTARVSAFYGNSTEFLGTVAQAAIIIVGGAMVFRRELTVGELTAFVLYVNSFFAPIQQLVQLYNTYQQGQAAVTKLDELLSTPPGVLEKADAEELPPIEGEITIDNVTFGYDPATPVLREVNLNIAAGETFAFVGTTGAGKSTIAKLITRFYDPTSGRVLVDGHDIKNVTIDSLRSQLGVVPQEAFLFAGTIRDNIAFALPAADDEQILEACAAVGIDDLIARLPMGLDTPCHERGVTLSSGERQLIALARAFLAQPRVLILDEAMSNLDLGTEAKVERALDAMLQGRTAILIAHRLNTAMRANRIAVVADGRIAELGSHAELVALGGRYSDMYETWVRHLDDDRLVREGAGAFTQEGAGADLVGGE